MSRRLFLVFATLHVSQCSAAPETEAATVSADSACSATSAPDEACEPEDSCILCNANLDDCKNHSALDSLGDCNASKALLERISLQVRARVRKRVAAGKKAQILYIGPNELSWEKVFFFGGVLGDISHEASITLVEPLEAVHEQMRQRARRVDFHSLDILQAGVSASKGDARFLWYEPHCLRRILSSASPALQIGEEMIQGTLQHVGHWTGMDKLRVTYSLTHLPFIEKLKSKWKMNYSPETWDQGLALQLNSECVQELAVPIYDPPSLMKAAGFSFDQLDVLLVDAEGCDHDILKAFLAQPDFDPAFMQVTWSGYMNAAGGGKNGIRNLMRQVSDTGFDVHHDRGRGGRVMKAMRPLGNLKDSASREDTSRRSCEPENLCILCNAHMDDCKDVPALSAQWLNPAISKALLQKIDLQVRARMRTRIAAGEKAQILYIGPNDFSDEIGFFKKLLGDMTSEASIALVEPNVAVHEQIKKNADLVGFHRVEVLQAGAGASVSGLPFWWYEPHCVRRFLSSASPDLQIGEEIIQGVLEGASKWTSMDKTHTSMLMFFGPFKELLKSKGMNYSPETWERGLAPQLISECVQEIAVPILDPPSLMKAAGFSFDQLDVLLIDAEGFDHDILKAFLAQPDFDPAYIMFEWASFMNDGGGGRTGIRNLMRQLSERGFDVHLDKQDMQVVRSLGKLMDSAPHAATS